jgi:hypothetical protein
MKIMGRFKSEVPHYFWLLNSSFACFTSSTFLGARGMEQGARGQSFRSDFTLSIHFLFSCPLLLVSCSLPLAPCPLLLAPFETEQAELAKVELFISRLQRYELILNNTNFKAEISKI